MQLADADIPAKKRGRPKALEKSGRPAHSGLQATAYTPAATIQTPRLDGSLSSAPGDV